LYFLTHSVKLGSVDLSRLNLQQPVWYLGKAESIYTQVASICEFQLGLKAILTRH